MDARFSTVQVKIEIWITPAEAKEILNDFTNTDSRVETSTAGKKLYATLKSISRLAEPFTDKPLTRVSAPYSELHDQHDDLETVSLPKLPARSPRTIPDDPDENSP